MVDPSTSAWVTIQSVNGNNLVKREVVLPAPVKTSAIRVLSRAAGGGYSRIVENEAVAG